MKEIKYDDWQAYRNVEAGQLKVGDIVKMDSIYIIKDKKPTLSSILYNPTCLTIEDVYSNYKEKDIIREGNSYVGERVYMPSIDISDSETYKALLEVYNKTLAAFPIDQVHDLKVGIIANFDSAADKVGLSFSRIKYTEFIMPVRELKAVSNFSMDINYER